MSKTSFAVFALNAVAFLAVSATAEAQAVRRGLYGPRVFTGPGGPTVLTPGYGSGVVSATSVGPAEAPAPVPYSYFAVPPGVLAREYVGYGQVDFPFYGRPYGHPYDRWSWDTLSSNDRNVLYRYYAPPLR